MEQNVHGSGFEAHPNSDLGARQTVEIARSQCTRAPMVKAIECLVDDELMQKAFFGVGIDSQVDLIERHKTCFVAKSLEGAESDKRSEMWERRLGYLTGYRFRPVLHEGVLRRQDPARNE